MNTEFIHLNVSVRRKAQDKGQERVEDICLKDYIPTVLLLLYIYSVFSVSFVRTRLDDLILKNKHCHLGMII